MRVKVYLKGGGVISYLLSWDKKQQVQDLKHEIAEIISGKMEIESPFVNFIDLDMINAYEVAAITIRSADAE